MLGNFFRFFLALALVFILVTNASFASETIDGDVVLTENSANDAPENDSEIVDESLTTPSSDNKSEGEDSIVAPLIIGGADSIIFNDPYMVALLSSGAGSEFQRQFCGGSLLNERWVITAAHCVKGKKTSSVRILVGATCLDEIGSPCTDFELSFQQRGTEFGVNKIVIHPSYNSRSLKNDIALVELSDKVTEPFVVDNFAELPASPEIIPDEDGVSGLILGWGADTEYFGDALTYSQILQFGYVEILTPRPGMSCESWEARYDSRTQICIRGFTYSDGIGNTPAPCFGDSGGPLMYDNGASSTLVGIASYVYAYGCQDTYFPPVYTRVSSYLDWINKNARSQQTISFTQPPSLTPSAASSYTLNAEASSGREIVFSSLSPTCSVNSSTGAILSVSIGTCRISASQPGDETYLPAKSVVRQFKVAKLAQRVTVTDLGGFSLRNLSLTPSQIISSLTLNISHTGESDSSLINSRVSPSSSKICAVSESEVVTPLPKLDRNGSPVFEENGDQAYETGTCTVEIWKDGNPDYLRSTTVKTSFKIAKKSQKIRFSALSNLTGKRVSAISLNSPDQVLVSADSLNSNNTSTELGNAAINSLTSDICNYNFGGFLDLYGLGTCRLMITAQGNQEYNSAKPVIYNIKVTKATPLIYYSGNVLPLSAQAVSLNRDGHTYLGVDSDFEASGFFYVRRSSDAPPNNLTFKFSSKSCGIISGQIVWTSTRTGNCTVSITAPSDVNNNKVTRTLTWHIR